MPDFDRFTVKHGSPYIHNDCYQWFSDSFRVHHIRFRPGLRPAPDPTGGRLSVLLQTLYSWFNGPFFYGGGAGRERGSRNKNGRGKELEGPPPPLHKFLDPLLQLKLRHSGGPEL